MTTRVNIASGRIGSFISVGGAWAEVSNTPLSYFKTTTYEGGIQTPLIVAGGPVEKRGIVTDQMLHVADIVPTMLELAGLERPTERNGYPSCTAARWPPC